MASKEDLGLALKQQNATTEMGRKNGGTFSSFKSLLITGTLMSADK